MQRRYSITAVGTGLLARSSTGRDIAAEFRSHYTLRTAPTLELSLGRVVVRVRGSGITARPASEQFSEACRIADITRAHLASGPWYTRRLVQRAVTTVFEDRGVEGPSSVLRYVEYTMRAPER